MSPRRKTKPRGPCALVSALTGPVGEVAERADGALALRKRRPRFDPEGRRLARIHPLYRPGQGAERGKVGPLIRDRPDRLESGSRKAAFRSASATP